MANKSIYVCLSVNVCVCVCCTQVKCMQFAIFARLDGQLAFGLCLFLSSSDEVTGKQRHAWLFTGSWWRPEFGSSCLYSH